MNLLSFFPCKHCHSHHLNSHSSSDHTCACFDHSLQMQKSERNLRLTALAQLFFVIFQITGAFLTGSQALFSDAVHALTDSISVFIAWLGEIFSHLKPDKKRTFGYQRISLFSSLIISTLVIISAVFVIINALRIIIGAPTAGHTDHAHVHATGMLIFAVIGLAYSLFFSRRLHAGSTLNEKALSWHLFLDAGNWLITIISALIIEFTGWFWLDATLGIVYMSIVLFNVLNNLAKTINLFLQGVPDGIDIDHLDFQICQEIPSISLSELRVWSLDGRHSVCTAKILLKSKSSKFTSPSRKSSSSRSLSRKPSSSSSSSVPNNNPDPEQIKAQIRAILKQHNILDSVLEISTDSPPVSS